MLESFGARLRQRREEQAMTLITIAEQTKIKLSLLEALERDDVSHWPSGIFRRAFIRAYAHAIGLDPDVVVREFLDVYPEPAEVVTTEALAAVVDGARRPGGPPTRLRNIVDSAIGSLSRLRRSPGVEEPAVANDAPLKAPRAVDSELLPAPVQSPEPGPVLGRTDVPGNAPSEAHTPEPPGMRFDVAGVGNAGNAGSADAVDHVGADPVVAAATDPSPPPRRSDRTTAVVTDDIALNAAPPPGPDLLAVAHLCTELGRVQTTQELQPLLGEAASMLEAIGLIVWVWDPVPEELTPALAHGYSDRVLAQLPAVSADADNATAAAFRSAQTCAIDGGDRTSGALVVPLLTAGGCAGVLAIELPHGMEQARWVRAVATMLAAVLAQLVGGSRPAEARPPAEIVVSPAAMSPTPVLRTRVRR
jgi:transcriptional regulator with XRE-family HTH domain